MALEIDLDTELMPKNPSKAKKKELVERMGSECYVCGKPWQGQFIHKSLLSSTEHEIHHLNIYMVMHLQCYKNWVIKGP